MGSYNGAVILAVTCTVLALPAVGVGVLYYLTNDPSLRPLSITREKLADIDGQTEYTLIFVHVNWGRERVGGMTKADLRKMISDTLFYRTDSYIFKFQEVTGDAISVTFVVGANRYGPYPPSRAVDGIIPALVALDMTRNTNR